MNLRRGFVAISMGLAMMNVAGQYVVRLSDNSTIEVAQPVIDVDASTALPTIAIDGRHIGVDQIASIAAKESLSAPTSTFTPSSITLCGVEPTKFDEDNGIITFHLDPKIDLRALRLDFNLEEGTKVTVGDVVQVPSYTSNDFRMPVRYRVEEVDGTVHNYVVAVAWTDMPVLYLDTHGTAIDSRETYVEKVDLLLVNSDWDAEYSGAKIKGRGNSSWGQPKRSYTMKLDKKDKFAGLAKHKTFALVASYSDKSMMRNTIAYEMGRRFATSMKWNPSTRFAHLVHNGEYLGVYVITETVKIDKNRIDIPTLEDCTDEKDADNYGFVVEFNERMDETLAFRTNRNAAITLKEPDGADILPELHQVIKNKVNAAERALYNQTAYPSGSSGYFGNYIDFDSYVDWLLINEVAKNNDSVFYSSVFMYFDPEDGKFHFGPLWDFDIAFGNVNYNNNDSYEGFWTMTQSWGKQMSKDKELTQLIKARWAQLSGQLKEYVASEIPAMGKRLAPDAAMNFGRWDVLGQYVWPNADGYEQRTTYQSEVDYLVDWLKRRIEWLDKAIPEL